mgnify:CR=1 FL=1
MPSPARPSAVQKQLDLNQQKEEESRTEDLMSELQLENPSASLADLDQNLHKKATNPQKSHFINSVGWQKEHKMLASHTMPKVHILPKIFLNTKVTFLMQL